MTRYEPTETGTPVTRQRRAPKGEKRREELLDAALQVFSLEGYTGASVAKVAAIVGISVAGLLHHFPSKISLLMGVLERRDEVNGRIAAQVRTDNTLTGLLGGLRAINRSNATRPAWCVPFRFSTPKAWSTASPRMNGSRRAMSAFMRTCSGSFQGWWSGERCGRMWIWTR